MSRFCPARSDPFQTKRITYINAEGEQPVISGAEIVDEWKPYKETIWC